MSNADEPVAGAGSADPPPQEGITAIPPPAVPHRGDLPSVKGSADRPLTPEALARATRQLDWLLIGLLLVLAFLVASFAIHNGDFWLHLATGRALAEGTYNVFSGSDPFSYMTEGIRWVNHSWLFDWLVYGLYNLAGGQGLALARALLGLTLAVVLLQIRRPRQSLWAPVVCVGLALLALSPRLLFQPVLVSYLFLGITLYLLLRNTGTPDAEARPVTFEVSSSGQPVCQSRRHLWLLPPLFVLWVNLDNWFLLGPLTVALVLLGTWLDQALSPSHHKESKPIKQLAQVLGVGLVACLLNPNHIRAFTLPPELAYLVVRLSGPSSAEWLAAGSVMRDIGGVPFLFSPLLRDYWSQPYGGLNVSGMAYFVLLALGLLSFVLCARARLRAGAAAAPTNLWPRMLLWLVFATLSLLLARLIPFFVIVAGPVTALNLQEFAWRRFGMEVRVDGRWRLWSLGGRLLTALGCLGLVFLAWPGWLHGGPQDPRFPHRVAWRVYVNPSLQRVAERICALDAPGELRGFSVHPDVAYYLSWFCPQAKSFLDQRFGLFAGSAEEYVRARRSLRAAGEYLLLSRQNPGMAPPPEDWREIFQNHKINFVVLKTTDADIVQGALFAKLWRDSRNWPLLYADGRTMVFGWRAPGQPDLFRGQAVDFNKLAFGKVPENRQAPSRAPDPPQGPRGFWLTYWLGPPERPLAASEGRFYVQDFDLAGQAWFDLIQSWKRLDPWPDRWLGPVGLAAVIPGSVSGPAALATAVAEPRLFLVDNGPPGDPVMAVRAARRAIAASPDESSNYLLLAAGYQTLWARQEQRWLRRPPGGPESLRAVNVLDRQTLRQIQVTAALNEFIRLQPDKVSPTLADAHRELWQIYARLHYLDLALEHLRQYNAQLAVIQPRPDKKKQYDQEREVFARLLKTWEANVKQRQDAFDLTAARPLEGRLAAAVLEPYKHIDANNQQQVDRSGLGLAQKALELLQAANVSKLSVEEKKLYVELQLRLLLTMGRLHEAREGLVPGLRELLGPAYDYYQAALAAALGNYAEAQEALAQVETIFANAGKKHEALVRKLAEWDRSRLLLTLAFDPPIQTQPILRASMFVYQQLVARSYDVPPAGPPHGAIRVLRGLLALEQGDTAAAAGHFEEALRRAGPTEVFSDQPLAVRYLRLLKGS
jgi:hypothetical protein